jgi:DNA processing protein
MNVQKLTMKDSGYPESLRNIPSPPKELYIQGNLETLLDKPRLAVVGSRRVTSYGKQITSQLGREVAARGVVIVSGLAFGVDAAAHQAAIEQNGYTIAVLPCGLDKIYPTTHTQLAKKILDCGGALISEYPDGTPPLRQHFVARNRIVSGLADALLITESAEKSGTIHTANFALEQGRTVMAVPGNITSPLSVGTNKLIKAGAEPVTNVSDILHTLGISGTGRTAEVLAANKEEQQIIHLLKQGITDTPELLILSELDAVLFNQTLTMLEITGKIRPLGAGHWTLVS